MLSLTFLTVDRTEIQLAQSYWALNSSGEWAFSMNELATKFSCKRTSIPTLVRRYCVAHAQSIVCVTCNKNPKKVHSRTEYDATIYKVASTNRWSRRSQPHQCQECTAEATRILRLENQEKILSEKLIVTRFLDNLKKIFESKNYTNIPVKDAFLLYGILSNSDEYFEDGTLASIKSNHTILFAHPNDTIEAYKYLCLNSWITLNPSSKFSSFSVVDSEIDSLDIHSVDWILAKDCSNIPFNQFTGLLEKTLFNAAPADLIDIWYWVCISELRKYFEDIQVQFNLEENLWKPLIEQKLKELLKVCSVGQAKDVIRITLTNIVESFQDNHYAKAHVYNMIPSNFLRTFERSRADGFKLRTWDRPSIEHEAIFTGLLFDKLMGGGTNFYNELTGEKLEQMIAGTNNSPRKRQGDIRPDNKE
nr:hypothetical protein [uncultured Undibacterium sp.]